MERDPIADFKQKGQLEDPSERAVKISAAQGGTMLVVKPLARQGFTPTDISSLTGISYQAVASAEKRMRLQRIIPESRQEFNKRLVATLEDLPKDPAVRKSLISMINFSFYRDHREFFTTPRSCAGLSGLGNLMFDQESTRRILSLFDNAGIAVREFPVANREGETTWFYRIMYKDDQEKAVDVLRNAPELIKPF